MAHSQRPQACSRLSRLLGEPLIGTAPVATAWVVVEQPGPWGRHALTDSHFDARLGGVLEASAGAHGARVNLIRRPGRHPDPRRAEGTRQVWIAWTRPGSTWLLGGIVDDPGVLESLRWDALARGERDTVLDSVGGLEPEADPLLLVCTNGRRDVCCATFGRPIVAAARTHLPGRVWETTHLSGHRFAPTAMVLPAGVVHGRLDDYGVAQIVDDARRGRLSLAGYRGRSTFQPPAQAAELAVRKAVGLTGLDDVDVGRVDQVDDLEESWQVLLSHPDGRRWRVRVSVTTPGPPRPESCNKAFVAQTGYLAGPVEND